MKGKGRGTIARQTAFWDSSAIVPLCCFQPQSAKARQTARLYGRQVVWWATAVESKSALNRLLRNGNLTAPESRQAFRKLEFMRQEWNEVHPSELLREQAERLLGIHELRAADALQLSAALVWCSQFPRGHYLIGSDNRLSNAAEAEGSTVIRLT